MQTQTIRQWIVPHEWMTKPTAQTEWIEKQGLLVWLSEVFSALGTGLYLVSIFLNNWWGALVGFLIVMMLKLPLHLLYLGKPLRFWRTIPPFSGAWKTSWIARGVVFTIFFSLFAFIQLITSYLLIYTDILTGTLMGAVSGLDILLRILAGIFVVLTGIYCGFMMSFCKSVPFWNSGILPIVILNAGIADGLALIMGIGIFTGGLDFHAIEYASRFVLGINALLIGTYLLNSSYQSSTAHVSVTEVLRGSVAIIFWVGIVLCGIIVPLSVSFLSILTGNGSIPLLVGAIICHTAGAFALKYCILKVGIHKPIIPKLIY